VSGARPEGGAAEHADDDRSLQPAGDTGGRVSVVEHPIDPGILVPPHIHSREDQISYVIDGEVEMLVGDDVLHCAAGAYVFKPRGVRHGFWNLGTDRPA
jgi:quercetin dioxygenase-like cupin family protein